MFAWFEGLVHPYPDAAPASPPKGFMLYLWSCTEGTRGYIAAMTFFTALIGAFEALLFAMMGLTGTDRGGPSAEKSNAIPRLTAPRTFPYSFNRVFE